MCTDDPETPSQAHTATTLNKMQQNILENDIFQVGTGQNISGTRAGTIDRGAKTFFRKKN